MSDAFEIRAWVNISQDYGKTMKRDLLIRILELASPGKLADYETHSEDKLGEDIHKCLKGKKYLIVMDDIWSIEAWNDIQRSFPREYKGSKVVFTSRELVQPDSICCIHHSLAPLSKSYSWELLQKKVFGTESCPWELVDIGEQIAEKCGGLPLGIVAIAGTLATEDKTLDMWNEVAKNLSSVIANTQEECMEILALSYNHLPLHLKACFLYIGAYPEDYEIPVRELIWFWIAEGFIQQSEVGKSLENVAKDYLTDLIDRSLVMVTRKSKSLGGIKACRIHDLLRQLCLKKAEEDNFLVHINKDDSFSPSITDKYRRLFVGGQFFHKFLSLRDRNLRSFLCLSLPNSVDKFLPQEKYMSSSVVQDLKLMRVLHYISGPFGGEIEIGDLVHLRYLALKTSESLMFACSRAPSSFHYLPNLETLNLQNRSGRRISLPRDILKMVKLRHLYTKGGRFEYHVPKDEEEEGNILDSLQTLHRICSCKSCWHFLKRTPNLRKLGLVHRGSVWDDDLMLPDLGSFKCLETLRVKALVKGKRVAITGLKLPLTLNRLTLQYTFLKWDELTIILQTLPNLEVLKLLDDACKGSDWDTSELEEGFSRLKYLKLDSLDIEKWNAFADEFPRLEVLVVEYCENLKEIPIDFCNLMELREIQIEWCASSLEKSATKIREVQKQKKGDNDCLNLIKKLSDYEKALFKPLWMGKNI